MTEEEYCLHLGQNATCGCCVSAEEAAKIVRAARQDVLNQVRALLGDTTAPPPDSVAMEDRNRYQTKYYDLRRVAQALCVDLSDRAEDEELMPGLALCLRNLEEELRK